MTKLCIFCGEKPEKKNKEHVIPKWLIKLTGDENREISLGLNFHKIFNEIDSNVIEQLSEKRIFSFKSFQFPACTTCNTKYSNLESNVSNIFRKILKDEYINTEEINNLLDWFDKVRVGLWLGMVTLDKVKDVVKPKFHINQRIAKRDRALYIYKISKEDNSDGINFLGVNTPAFHFAPSLFGLRVNNFVFVNYSKEDLLSKNLGFPYIELIGYADDGIRQVAEIFNGRGVISTPIISNQLPKTLATFYQSIFSEDLYGNDIEWDEYSQKNLCSIYKNRSKIFYYDQFSKKIETLDKEDEIIIQGTSTDRDIRQYVHKLNILITEEQEKFLHFKHHLNYFDQEAANKTELRRKNLLQFHKVVKKLIIDLSKKYE